MYTSVEAALTISLATIALDLSLSSVHGWGWGKGQVGTCIHVVLDVLKVKVRNLISVGNYSRAIIVTGTSVVQL